MIVNDGKPIKARASILALFFYITAFREDMTAAISKFFSLSEKITQINNNELDVFQSALDELSEIGGKLLWSLYKANQYAVRKSAVDYNDFDAPNVINYFSAIIPLLKHGYIIDNKRMQKGNNDKKTSKYSDFVIVANCLYLHMDYNFMNDINMTDYIALVEASTPDSNSKIKGENDKPIARKATDDETAAFFMR